MRSSETGVSEPVGRLAALQPRLGFLMLIFVGLGCAACERTTDTRLITLAGAGPQGRYFKEVSILSKVLTERMPASAAYLSCCTTDTGRSPSRSPAPRGPSGLRRREGSQIR